MKNLRFQCFSYCDIGGIFKQEEMEIKTRFGGKKIKYIYQIEKFLCLKQNQHIYTGISSGNWHRLIFFGKDMCAHSLLREQRVPHGCGITSNRSEYAAVSAPSQPSQDHFNSTPQAQKVHSQHMYPNLKLLRNDYGMCDKNIKNVGHVHFP